MSYFNDSENGKKFLQLLKETKYEECLEMLKQDPSLATLKNDSKETAIYLLLEQEKSNFNAAGFKPITDLFAALLKNTPDMEKEDNLIKIVQEIDQNQPHFNKPVVFSEAVLEHLIKQWNPSSKSESALKTLATSPQVNLAQVLVKISESGERFAPPHVIETAIEARCNHEASNGKYSHGFAHSTFLVALIKSYAFNTRSPVNDSFLEAGIKHTKSFEKELFETLTAPHVIHSTVFNSFVRVIGSPFFSNKHGSWNEQNNKLADFMVSAFEAQNASNGFYPVKISELLKSLKNNSVNYFEEKYKGELVIKKLVELKIFEDTIAFSHFIQLFTNAYAYQDISFILKDSLILEAVFENLKSISDSLSPNDTLKLIHKLIELAKGNSDNQSKLDDFLKLVKDSSGMKIYGKEVVKNLFLTHLKDKDKSKDGMVNKLKDLFKKSLAKKITVKEANDFLNSYLKAYKDGLLDETFLKEVFNDKEIDLAGFNNLFSITGVQEVIMTNGSITAVPQPLKNLFQPLKLTTSNSDAPESKTKMFLEIIQNHLKIALAKADKGANQEFISNLMYTIPKEISFNEKVSSLKDVPKDVLKIIASYTWPTGFDNIPTDMQEHLGIYNSSAQSTKVIGENSEISE